ncbi:phosphoribosylformylglycinamidine cyclo-ligase [Emergencia sp. 1XD21-10]|uniref:phosphoribosylformylglycinamidine cyclo-ligase n=1 Tax=Emergencia sp. 1XD21-10 TaxID=2304569 RepID=UPI00137947B8|nr:phosphoribosylformylglycinamidine cyclo-ligase [Emergencia sp. 1XD21-10]MCI9639593.1 phosphoribosylformylglycinamidine cyclo-ligase [Emergencia sp.]NCE98939.1 phosphoribosylformylglycinamidine cyclo-ligase [Emergencia sp. 1XD21-10]
MGKSFSESYKEAGVDITAGYKAVELMKEHVAKTMVFGNVPDDIGGFGGLFELDVKGMERPVLVSGTDGVGTKLKMAFLMDKHDTVGIDCVAMCVNDILCVGAKPLFFLDYIAVGKNYPEKVAQIVSGVAEGCIQSEAALIGGETAEMPGFYPEDEYDLAGFAVGVVDKSKVLKKETVEEGDVIIGLPSSGVHSNGFSLVRKVLDVENEDIKTPVAELGGKSIGETLLTPTKIYVKPMLKLFDEVTVKAAAHITGGGFYENIPRSLPKGYGAKIKKENVRVLPIFKLIAEKGSIPERDMFNTFNMGVGMTVIVSAKDADKALEVLHAAGEDAYILGEVVKSEEGVELW